MNGITIQVKLDNGFGKEFNSVSDLSMWLKNNNFQACENGWTELNEYCQRRVAYGPNDTNDLPSCEIIVNSENLGQAEAFVFLNEHIF